MSSNSFKQLVADLQKTPAYWHETAKFEFSVGLDEVLRASGMSRADLARALGTSQAYVTKILRGDTNFTIETMVNAARAAGGDLVLKVVKRNDPAMDSAEIRDWWRRVQVDPGQARRAFEFADWQALNHPQACNDPNDENEPLAA